jgi:hypothetical protein
VASNKGSLATACQFLRGLGEQLERMKPIVSNETRNTPLHAPWLDRPCGLGLAHVGFPASPEPRIPTFIYYSFS